MVKDGQHNVGFPIECNDAVALSYRLCVLPIP